MRINGSPVSDRKDEGVDKGELEYRKEMAKWYINEGKRQLKSLPGWIQTLIAVLGVIILLMSFALAWQAVKPAPGPGEQVVTVDTSPGVVPDLKFMDRSQAEAKLSQMGFSSVSIQEMKEYASNDTQTIVIEQKPAPGSTIRKNETVTLYYGSKALYDKGKKEVTMPSVVGLSVNNAQAALAKAGFVKVIAPLPANTDKNRLVVTSQKPQKDEKVTLNDEVQLTLELGLQWDEVDAKLKAGFPAYKSFSKAEVLKGEDIQLTLAAKDPNMTSEAMLSERARSYKLGIEQVLGRTIGRVVLVNPGVEAMGDSNRAARRLTDQGLSVEAARVVCDGEAGNHQMRLDWVGQTLKEEIAATQINLSVVGTVDSTGQETVILCSVGGPGEQPTLVSFDVK